MATSFHSLDTNSSPTHQNHISASERRSLPASRMGLPGAGKYPMPDRKHAVLAEGFASRYATPAQRAEIDAKARRILGK